MWAGFEPTIQRNTWKNRIGCDIISALWSAVWNASIWLAVTEFQWLWFQLSTAGPRGAVVDFLSEPGFEPTTLGYLGFQVQRSIH